MIYPTRETLLWHMADRQRVETLWRNIRNADRSARRRELYRDDPLWRLSKLKDNRERRLRAKLERG